MNSFPKWLPPFVILPLITPEEAADVIKLAENSNSFKPAQVMYPTGEIAVDEDHCRCSIATFRTGTPINSLFTARMLGATDDMNRHYSFDLYREPEHRVSSISILRYEATDEQFFRPHVDLGGQRGVDKRKLTVIVPLNADFEGGQLHVDVGSKYNVQKRTEVGQAMVFPSFMMHHVTPVTQGTRYVAVGWMQGPHFR